MKKFVILLSVLLLISGCSSSSDLYKEKNESTKSESNQSTNMQTSQNSNQPQSENLFAEYKTAIIKTDLGNLKIEFYGNESPDTVNNFLTLAKKGFYDGTRFHRVIKDFMIQGGDPNSKDDDWSNDGIGGPGYQFSDEFNNHALVRGSLAMANSGPNTNGSQFFIVTASSTPWLDGKHTNFGKVVEGIDIIDKIEAVETTGDYGNPPNHPKKDVTINSIELIK